MFFWVVGFLAGRKGLGGDGFTEVGNRCEGRKHGRKVPVEDWLVVGAFRREHSFVPMCLLAQSVTIMLRTNEEVKAVLPLQTTSVLVWYCWSNG